MSYKPPVEQRETHPGEEITTGSSTIGQPITLDRAGELAVEILRDAEAARLREYIDGMNEGWKSLYDAGMQAQNMLGLAAARYKAERDKSQALCRELAKELSEWDRTCEPERRLLDAYWISVAKVAARKKATGALLAANPELLND